MKINNIWNHHLVISYNCCHPVMQGPCPFVELRSLRTACKWPWHGISSHRKRNKVSWSLEESTCKKCHVFPACAIIPLYSSQQNACISNNCKTMIPRNGIALTLLYKHVIALFTSIQSCESKVESMQRVQYVFLSFPENLKQEYPPSGANKNCKNREVGWPWPCQQKQVTRPGLVITRKTARAMLWDCISHEPISNLKGETNCHSSDSWIIMWQSHKRDGKTTVFSHIDSHCLVSIR